MKIIIDCTVEELKDLLTDKKETFVVNTLPEPEALGGMLKKMKATDGILEY